MGLFINQRIDTRLSYRHFDRERVPFAGNASQITAKEYPFVTKRLRVAGYGLFDVSKPEQQHFGRTLSDLLNRAHLEQYVISVMQPYHEWVSKGEDKELVFKLWVIWYEQVDVSKAAADAYAETLELPAEKIDDNSTDGKLSVIASQVVDGGSPGDVRANRAGRRKAASNSKHTARPGKISHRGGGGGSIASRHQ